jgi:hypothetical protein
MSLRVHERRFDAIQRCWLLPQYRPNRRPTATVERGHERPICCRHAMSISPRTRPNLSVIIPVPAQYKCIGCSPGKHLDTRAMATGSDDDSRDSVHARCLCIRGSAVARPPITDSKAGGRRGAEKHRAFSTSDHREAGDRPAYWGLIFLPVAKRI